MKVDNTPGLRGTTATRRADKGAARGGEFARHLDGSSQASGAGAASGVSVAAGIAGILSLQGSTTPRLRASAPSGGRRPSSTGLTNCATAC
jgi:hypothetical protein